MTSGYLSPSAAKMQRPSWRQRVERARREVQQKWRPDSTSARENPRQCMAAGSLKQPTGGQDDESPSTESAKEHRYVPGSYRHRRNEPYVLGTEWLARLLWRGAGPVLRQYC
jgi:hypothetical protein